MTSQQSEKEEENGPTFTGIIPPVVTPLRENGSTDIDCLERLTESLITAGVRGLFALGSTGEVAYLTDRQRTEVATTIARVAAGRVPVLAGAIDFTAARVVEQALPLVEAGVDAIVTAAPIYAINDVSETADHFRYIAGRIGVPLFAYDVPQRVHTKLSAQLLVDLACDGVLTGCKDSSGDDLSFRRLLALNEAAGHPLQVLTGHEVVVDAMALAGADGAVPGLANVDAAGYVRLWDAAQRGEWRSARTEQERLNRLFEIVFMARDRSRDATGVGAFKVAMVAQGLIANATMAHPVRPLDGPEIDRIKSIVRDVGLI